MKQTTMAVILLLAGSFATHATNTASQRILIALLPPDHCGFADDSATRQCWRSKGKRISIHVAEDTAENAGGRSIVTISDR